MTVPTTLLFLFVSVREASACVCMKRSTQEYLEEADTVFRGEVVSVQRRIRDYFRVLIRLVWGDEAATFESHRIAFRITEVFKGELGPQVEVVSFLDTAACGVPFRETGQYVVFALRSEDLFTSRCLGTRLATDEVNQELSRLFPGG